MKNKNSLEINLIQQNIRYTSHKIQMEEQQKFFSFENLDEVEDQLELIQKYTIECKSDLIKRIENSFEHVKKIMVDQLETFYKKFYKMVNEKSQYEIMDKMILNFMNLKSEYEFEESFENKKNLEDSINKLANLENVGIFHKLLNTELLKKILKKIEDNFNKKKLKKFFNFLGIGKSSGLCKNFKINFDIFEKVIEFESKNMFLSNTSKKYLDPEFQKLGKILESLKEKTHINNNFQSKNNQVIGRSLCSFLNNFYNKQKYSRGFAFAKKQYLMFFEIRGKQNLDMVGLNSIQKNKEKSLLELIDFSNSDYPFSVLNIEFFGKMRDFILSPCEKYIGIIRENSESLIFRFYINERKTEPILICFFNSQISIEKFIFLDSEKLVCNNSEGNLFIYDLKRKVLELEFLEENIKSLHYIDSNNFLFTTNTESMGVFNVDTNEVTSKILYNIGQENFQIKEEISEKNQFFPIEEAKSNFFVCFKKRKFD